MQDAQTWRELLAAIVQNSQEKQRLIEELSITPITLTRWINGESDPRPQNLRHLMNALPQYREQFRVLLKHEKGLGELAHSLQDHVVKAIPSEFYASVLTARATTHENLRFWLTCHLILQQALGQLDPGRQGLAIWVVRCMPPSGPHNKIRSLRESIGQGTGLWAGNLEQDALFLGAESLAGNVVTLCRPGIIHNTEEVHYMTPSLRVEHEKSAAIYPLLYAGRIAGVFLISSTQKNFFLSSARSELVQRYADLVTLAFDPHDFYTPDQIALCIMPPPNIQREYFVKFRQLVTDTMRNAARENQHVSNPQADILVWQQLEDILLKIPGNGQHDLYT